VPEAAELELQGKAAHYALELVDLKAVLFEFANQLVV
jgi:hypothetical protein